MTTLTIIRDKTPIDVQPRGNHKGFVVTNGNVNPHVCFFWILKKPTERRRK